ncbi:type II toxin-antitoxin system VapC family toxin [Bosea sp. TND4EK4]|uniref:type II toxin-antitoxin system VapC family toxin n=1 Tax=Bosea sp. TND4EK4 TaxID=1907408 RepID=UPI0009542FDB|nr:type II toxin-antitoxin system VapC family toxin [Bosea sp. TND4EK4]SIR48281.1 tRNA(fMet)-specific endonuclease VapC [Bosea sp. TND4EK4]
MICLDANVVIAIVTMRNTKLRRRLGEALHAGTPIVLPVVALQELRYGFAKSTQHEVEEQRFEKFLSLGIAILPFEADDALQAAEIRTAMDVYYAPMDPYDALVAAQALRHGATLATLNKEGFERVPGLKVMDWAE